MIEQVNTVKTGSNPISIIGWSMGGLVARWCLKDMEDNGIQHHVQNFFSYDAPQQGANIPLGLQYLFHEIANDLPWLKWFSKDFRQIEHAFQSQAARQMLVTYGGNAPSTINPVVSTLDPLRATFAQRLQNKGYPSQTNNYAIAFGRGNNTLGTKTAGNGTQFTPANPFGPGTKIFDGNSTFILINFQSSAYAVPEGGNTDYVARYRFEGLTLHKLFGLPILPLVELRIRNFKYTGQYSYDDAPGGYNITQQQFVANITAARGLAGNASDYTHDAHNFVSTASALDLQNQGYGSSNSWQSGNLYDNIDGNIASPGAVGGNLISPGLSPFKAVVTATSDVNGYYNVYHNDVFQQQFANFIIRELLNANASPDCTNSGFCNATPAIGGTSPVCSSSTFTVSGVPNSGIKIQWGSSNGNFSIIGGQGTPTVTIKKLNDGKDNLTFTMTNVCGVSRSFSKPIEVGIPLAVQTVTIPGNLCPNTFYTADVNPTEYYFSYVWVLPQGWSCNGIPNGLPNQYTTSDYELSFQTGQSGGPGTLLVAKQNACGQSDWYYANSDGSCNGFAAFAVTPNPASNEIRVSVNNNPPCTIKDPKAKAFKKYVANTPSGIKRINIFDVNGKLRKSFVGKGAETLVDMDVSQLNNGVYFLEIYGNTNKSQRTKVIVQH